MHDQPYYRPLNQSDFFADERSARSLPAGTVARGQLRQDAYFYTGTMGGQPGDVMPFPINERVLRRGQERFNIYCAPCHGMTGEGNGMIVQRGFRRAASFHERRLQEAPVGYFVDVMTSGFGAMPDYSAQISPHDRWTIVSYIRALQLSQRATVADVPADQRGQLQTPRAPTEPVQQITPPPATSPGPQEQPR